MWDLETRAKVIFVLLCLLGLCGFLYVCVVFTTCGACYIKPCCVPLDSLENLYKVNSSLCFVGATTGMFFFCLSGWGALLTLRRRASVMGFGHFFGVSILVKFLHRDSCFT